MSTKIQKRETKQIRISESLHRLIKLESAKIGKTISRLVDGILINHFDEKEHEKQNNIP